MGCHPCIGYPRYYCSGAGGISQGVPRPPGCEAQRKYRRDRCLYRAYPDHFQGIPAVGCHPSCPGGAVISPECAPGFRVPAISSSTIREDLITTLSPKKERIPCL